MKSKTLRTTGIVIGSLALLILLIAVGSPLLVRLGVKPVCIQGDLAHLRIVSCPDSAFAQATVTPLPLPTLADGAPIPVIVDDDGSPDGIVALLYFLRHPNYEVKAVTVSAGEAHPELFARHLSQLLASFGREDIPVGYGQDAPLAGTNAFPESWRQASDDFWGVPLPQTSASSLPRPAAGLIVETLSQATRPVMMFVSGTHTNLAEALRLDPSIGEHIRGIYVMGGSVYIPGNIESEWPNIHNRTAEWNIWVDPQAAKEVFTSGLTLHLFPLDATNQILWTKVDGQAWNSSSHPESALAGEMLDMMLRSWSVESVYIWDLATAVSASDPRLCPETHLALDVVVEPGPDQGRTVVVDGPPNVWVCLAPDSEQLKAQAASILGR
jgi:pyrimidine-specific ribonucleoside hydrolase